MNVAAMFPEARTDAAKRLAEMAGRREELRAEVRQLREQEAAGRAERSQLQAELREAESRERAWGTGTDDLKRVRAQVAKAERATAARADEQRVVTDAIVEVERGITAHAREHADALWAELREDAGTVAQRLVAAIEELAAATGGYQAAGARAVEILRLTDAERLRVGRVPDPPDAAAQFARSGPDARRVVLPLPVPPTSVEVVVPAPLEDGVPSMAQFT